jgi:hypothetical protein
VNELDAGKLAQQLPREMAACSLSGGGIGDGAGVRLRHRDHVRDGVCGECGIDAEHEVLQSDEGDRREVAQRIVANLLQAHVGRESRDGANQERIAVRLGPGHGLGADDAAGTTSIVDHDRLAETLLQLAPNLARQLVDAAAGRGGDHQRNRSIGVRLCRGRGRDHCGEEEGGNSNRGHEITGF